jgi:glycosyltransferase involved in cell wall biosynthesis
MSLRVLFTCGREPEYPRNAVLCAALSNYFNVIEVTDGHHLLPLRYLRVIIKLLSVSRNDYEAMVVGFLGQPLMIVARLLSSKPILFDAFLSVYDTLCYDRKIFAPGSLVGKTAFWLDQRSCELADFIILDTTAHVEYFHTTFGIPRNKLASLFVGCDEDIFYPRPIKSTTPVVLYYGSYLPLQGIDVIVRAAKLLENHAEIHFRIIGEGMESHNIQSLVQDLEVSNIEFLPPVPIEELPDHIGQATVCLGGHFGSAEKASRVIAGKTFQCIAMGKPTIVGDNPANRELLTHGFDAWFCSMNDPQALANAILQLVNNPTLCEDLGKHAYQTFKRKASIQVLSEKLRDIVERLVESG